MKAKLFALFTTLCMVGYGSIDLDDTETLDKILAEAIDGKKLQLRGQESEELYHAPNQQMPYTGWAKLMHDNGQIKFLEALKGGKREGLSTSWYENGQKKIEGKYKDGKENGVWTSWYENGQQSSEVNFKDGKQNGHYASWYENGQQSSEVNCKYGKLDGLETRWYENGQKSSEGNYKDGKENGVWTWWYENNGQKKEEANWKDGKLMSAVVWKPNGEKCPVTNVKDGNGVLVWYNEYNEELTDLIRAGILEIEKTRLTYKDGRRIYPELSPASKQDGTERNQGGTPVSNGSKPDVVKLSPQDVFGGKFHKVKRKLENGADPDAILLPKGKRTALHCCCMGGRVKIVKLLLAGGASPNSLDKYNMSPLDILFSPDEKGRAPLERMSAENQLEIQRMLEKAGGKRNRLPSKELFNGKYINSAPKKDAIETAVDWSKLQDRSGVTYLPNTDKPFSGYAKRAYENEQIEVLAQFKDGYIVRVKQWQENGTPRWDIGFMVRKVAKSDVPLEDWFDANFSHNYGLSTFWYENGQKEGERNWKDGKLMSAKVWKSNGEKCPVTNIDKDGNGVVVGYNADGFKSWERTLKDGKPNGLSTIWHENGQKGEEGNWKDGKQDGLYTIWYENGQKASKRTIKDDKPDGFTTEWYENGQKKSEVNFKDGKQDGLYTSWHENGQQSNEVNFKDGKLMSAVSWKPNGEKCPVTNVKDGNGVSVWYWNNGKKSIETNYKDGKRHGLEIIWNRDGTEGARWTFKDGELVEDKTPETLNP